MGKKGLVNQENKTVIPFIYDDFDYFKDGLLKGFIKDEVITVDMTGQRIE